MSGISGVGGSDGASYLQAYQQQIQQLETDPNATQAFKDALDQEFAAVKNQILGSGESEPSSPSSPAEPVSPPPVQCPPAQSNPAQSDPVQAAATGAAGPSVTSAGSGSNSIIITNTSGHVEKLGKFINGQSTTDPSAEITLQPGQTGTISYQNGEAGFIAEADSSGKYQPNASRLEYEADADGKMKYPDVSYIDGRNASISLTDGQSLNKGDSKSIADAAPAGTVTTDAAGNKTIQGWYDGSTGTMQSGGAYLEQQLGTGGAYIHPNDDQNAAGANPMSGTTSSELHATFGDA